ncbi:class E sortase [Candidatus Daviesbacteria bacterium]|nr:class E sortase [Candidatus Daviesbacteria bacterium]
MITAGKFLSLTLFTFGVFLLIQVILPLVSFKIWEISQSMSEQILISPKPPQGREVLGISIRNQNNFPSFISDLKRDTPASYGEFRLTVPALKMESETVRVDSNDLTAGLVHLPGAALPGEKGNVFISGHSALSPLLGFKKAPFATLINMKKGDQIVVEAEGAKFIYQVAEIKTVDPTDLSVITPPESLGRYISLMTCVPPGLNLKRLIILGKMI